VTDAGEVRCAWERAVPGEVAFWRRFLTSEKFAHYSNAPLLKSYFRRMLDGRKRADILDVGSGACPTGGWTWPGVEVSLVQADALAWQYLALYEELGMQPVLPIEQQDMTAMTYPDASFDVVFCRNALNHCADPFRAVREMVRVVRPGGWVCLVHGEAPYKVDRFKDMHLWNISMAEDGADVVFWGRDSRFLLSECVLGFHSYQDRRQYKRCVIIMSYLHLEDGQCPR
jgi:SAM-dependent methyltransferase